MITRFVRDKYAKCFYAHHPHFSTTLQPVFKLPSHRSFHYALDTLVSSDLSDRREIHIWIYLEDLLDVNFSGFLVGFTI